MTLHDEFSAAWEMLVGRTTGPMALRLIFQPLMATLLAVRAGLQDAREGRPPYLWFLFSRPTDRRALLRDAWVNVRMVFLVAMLLDGIYQVIVFHWIFLVQDILVAAL